MSRERNGKITVSTELKKEDIDRLEDAAKKRGLGRATLIRLWILNNLNEEDNHGNG